MTSPTTLSSRRPSLRRVVASAAASAILLAGCGEHGSEELTALAASADRLATHLDAGDACAAEDEAQWLVTATAADLATGRIDAEVAADVRGVVAEVLVATRCDPAEDTDAHAEPDDETPTETETENATPTQDEDGAGDVRDSSSSANNGRGRGDGSPPGRGRGGRP